MLTMLFQKFFDENSVKTIISGVDSLTHVSQQIIDYFVSLSFEVIQEIIWIAKMWNYIIETYK